MFKCPKCGFELNEKNEKEFKRITKKNKREEKELKMKYMKDLREGHTTLEFSEWQKYKSQEKE